MNDDTARDHNQAADDQATDDATSVPPLDPSPDTNPAHGGDDKGAYAGRPDQGIKHTIGPGAGGATEWGGGNKNNPVRQNKNVRQGGG